MKRLQLTGFTLLLLLLVPFGARAQQPPAPAPTTPEPATTTAPAPTPEPATATAPAPAPAVAAAEAAPAMSCGDCHQDQMAAFARNAHAHGKAVKGVVPNAVCETCHGSGAAHIEGGGDKTKIFKPAGLLGSNKACLACHDIATDRLSRHSGAHANSATVNCLTCHSIHSADAHSAHLLAKPQLALCDTCHSPQVASFRNKPFAHRIGRGGMECTSCHEPHGKGTGREMLRLTRSGELPCVSCHTEKRGPFVFQHGSVALGDCLTCHEAHGSSNPKRLIRANVFQLCLECHSNTASNVLGSQPPSFHNLNSPRYRNCTTCHTAIHGSNRDPQLFK